MTKRLPGDERGHVPVARLATRAQRQLALVNGVLVALRQRMVIQGEQAASAEIIDLVATPLRRLLAVRHDRQFPMAPEIGLAALRLFTAGKGLPSLLQEIRRELASADQVDIGRRRQANEHRLAVAGAAAGAAVQGVQGAAGRLFAVNCRAGARSPTGS